MKVQEKNETSGQRIVIVGNSGSGKTFLANQISHYFGKVFHFDSFFWEPGGFNKKRPKEVVARELVEISEMDGWVVEGVFGELAELFINRATCLIWLDMNWETCQKNLLLRGSESSRQLEPQKAEENFLILIGWASKYWERTNSRSYTGHKKIFDVFPRSKYRLTSKQELDNYVTAISASYNPTQNP